MFPEESGDLDIYMTSNSFPADRPFLDETVVRILCNGVGPTKSMIRNLIFVVDSSKLLWEVFAWN